MSVPNKKKLLTDKVFKKKVSINKSKATVLEDSSHKIILNGKIYYFADVLEK